MSIIILPRKDVIEPLDRRIQWHTACFVLLGLAILCGVALELVLTGVGEAEVRFIAHQIRSLSTLSTLLLEFFQQFALHFGVQ